MSPLPSISHRLFVAALAPRKAARNRHAPRQPGSSPAANGKDRQEPELAGRPAARALNPLASRLDSPAFAAET